MLERHASVSQSVATTKPGRSPIPRELLIQPGCSVDLLRSFFVLFGGKHATLTFCHDTNPSHKTTSHERHHPRIARRGPCASSPPPVHRASYVSRPARPICLDLEIATRVVVENCGISHAATQRDMSWQLLEGAGAGSFMPQQLLEHKVPLPKIATFLTASFIFRASRRP